MSLVFSNAKHSRKFFIISWSVIFSMVGSCQNHSSNLIPTLSDDTCCVRLPVAQLDYRKGVILESLPLLIVAVTASSAAYSESPPPGWEKHVVNRAKIGGGLAASVFIARVDKENKIIEISIRGTNNVDDAYSDIKSSQGLAVLTGTAFHRGFLEISDLIYTKVRSQYSSQIENGYSLAFYGHSLGGAVASVVAMMFHQKGMPVRAVVTFGAPKFTNSEGARKYQVLNKKTFRVVNCNDPIPYFPPPSIVGWKNNGYAASGTVILLMNDGYFDVSADVDIERDFAVQLRNEFLNVKNHDGLAAGHRISSYVNLVSSIEVGAPSFYTMFEQDQVCDRNLGKQSPL